MEGLEELHNIVFFYLTIIMFSISLVDLIAFSSFKLLYLIVYSI